MRVYACHPRAKQLNDAAFIPGMIHRLSLIFKQRWDRCSVISHEKINRKWDSAHQGTVSNFSRKFCCRKIIKINKKKNAELWERKALSSVFILIPWVFRWLDATLSPNTHYQQHEHALGPARSPSLLDFKINNKMQKELNTTTVEG